MVASVADASVLAALIFEEPRADEAERLIGTASLFEPALLASELASVCRKKAQRHVDLQAQLLASLEIGLSMDIEWVEVDHVAVVETALVTGLTTYDATYLWLARILQAPLLTFDEQMKRSNAWVLA
jgi:predicted nucleic acid-binding protein